MIFSRFFSSYHGEYRTVVEPVKTACPDYSPGEKSFVKRFVKGCVMDTFVMDIHPETPQSYKVAKVASALKEGAVILYPTDTGFALGCAISNKRAITRVRDIRKIPTSKPLSFLCESLTNIAEFAKVSNMAYKTIKRLIPGPYTFILPASRAVPRLAQDPKRKTVGIRVPSHPFPVALLHEMGHPIISISAKNGDEDIDDHDRLIASMKGLVEIAVTSPHYDFVGESTVLDMTDDDDFRIVREGAGIENVQDFVAATT